MKNKLRDNYLKTGGGLIKRRQVLKGMSLGALTLAAGNTLSFSSALASPSGDVNMLVWEGYEPQEAFAHLSDVNVNRSFMSQNDDTITKDLSLAQNNKKFSQYFNLKYENETGADIDLTKMEKDLSLFLRAFYLQMKKLKSV